MLLLFETPAGFALFKVLDEGKLSKVEVYLVGTLFVILAAWYYFLTLFSFFVYCRIWGRNSLHPTLLDRYCF